MPTYLNRQMITLLSSRGIPDNVFLALLERMVHSLVNALVDNTMAQQLLASSVDIGYDEFSFAPMAAAYNMLVAGISVTQDAYLQGTMTAMYNRMMVDLQTRSRIFVPESVTLMGIMDETMTLQPGEVFFQLSGEDTVDTASLKRVLVGRSPSLHCGDYRILTPRSVPALSHLFDVVVFPALGDRPHPNEMSGGDLDGDIYFVVWNKALIPATDHAPASYCAPSQPPTKPGGVTVEDIQDFFVDYIRNDNLGQIANAHLVLADTSSSGALCAECEQLSALHSTAVDFLKTGVPADFPASLRPSKYPSFMNKVNKVSYESSKVLGRIHQICTMKTSHVDSQVIPFVDPDLCVPGYEVYLEEVSHWTTSYNDRLWRIMKHYGVRSEMEILSGFVVQFSRRMSSKDSKGYNDLQDRIRREIRTLKQDFVDIFLESLSVTSSGNSSSSSEDLTLPIVMSDQALRSVALRKASAWYMYTYMQEQYDGMIPLISAPWVVYSLLCMIKKSSTTSKVG